MLPRQQVDLFIDCLMAIKNPVKLAPQAVIIKMISLAVKAHVIYYKQCNKYSRQSTGRADHLPPVDIDKLDTTLGTCR